MMKGMSGFGQARAENTKFKITVQVRTLNHRYLDCTVYMPESLRELEASIKTAVKKKIRRGKVSIFVDIINKASSRPELNLNALKEYMRLAKVLGKKFGVTQEISFAQLVNLPSVLVQKQQASLEAGALKNLIMQPLIKATENVAEMREQEGRAIYKDFGKRLRIIKNKIDFIEQRLVRIFKQLKNKMTSDELNSFVKNCDVSEEIVRLRFHLNNAYRRASGASHEPRGKELDFICQELQRETNTLGSKVPDKHISSSVVKIKGELEKLREQLANVE